MSPVLIRLFLVALCIGAGASFAAVGAAPAVGQNLSFEVASVRPNGRPVSGPGGDPSAIPMIYARDNGRFRAVNTDLRFLVHYAYSLQLFESVEGDFALLDQRFDVEAVAGEAIEATPLGEEGPIKAMLRALLMDRFNLVVRWEQREEVVSRLVRHSADARLGPGLRRTELACESGNATSGANAARCNF